MAVIIMKRNACGAITPFRVAAFYKDFIYTVKPLLAEFFVKRGDAYFYNETEI